MAGRVETEAVKTEGEAASVSAVASVYMQVTVVQCVCLGKKPAVAQNIATFLRYAGVIKSKVKGMGAFTDPGGAASAAFKGFEKVVGTELKKIKVPKSKGEAEAYSNSLRDKLLELLKKFAARHQLVGAELD